LAPYEGQMSHDRHNGRDCWRANEVDAKPHGFPLSNRRRKPV
jgi:hypothetical protein